MKNSKIAFLTTMTMIGSFSITKTEFTPTEKVQLKKLAQQSIKKAILLCDEREDFTSICDPNSNYSKNLSLFLVIIDQMPAAEIASFIDKHRNNAAQKAATTTCINCQYLAQDLQQIASTCSKENHASTYFDLSVPKRERERADETTISHIIEQATTGQTKFLNQEQLQDLQQLEKEGKGDLTLTQLIQLKNEELLRKELALVNN